MKKENAATVLKALKIKNVAKQSLRNGAELKASKNPFKISRIPPPMFAHVSGIKCESFTLERLGMKRAGTMASSMQMIPTQTDRCRVAASAFSNQLLSVVAQMREAASAIQSDALFELNRHPFVK